MAMDSAAAKLFLSNPSAINTKGRIEALQAIRDVTDKLDHKSVKVVIVQLVRGLFLYRDKKSKNALLQTLEKVLLCHKTEAGNVLVSVLGTLTKEVAGRSLTVRVAISGLQWCKVGVAVSSITSDTPTWEHFVVHVCELYWFVVSNGNKKHVMACDKMLSALFAHAPISQYLDVLVAKEPHCQYLIVASKICSFCKEQEIVAGYTDQLVAMFLSVVITNRAKMSTRVMTLSEPLLSMVTEDHMIKTIQPALRRSLLRNPEIVLKCVSEMFRVTKRSLDCLAVEMGKTLLSCVDSTHSTQRMDAVEAFGNLVKKCTTQAALDGLLDVTREKMADGKKLGIEQRSSIVQMYGSLSESPATTAEMVKMALEDITKSMNNEMHETVLVALIRAVRKWLTTASDGAPPPCVVQQYKKLLSSKTTALTAKLEVYSSLSEEVIALEPSYLSEFEELFQSALKKPQVGTVGEAILSAATIHKNRKHLGGRLDALNSFVNNDFLSSEKIISSVSPEVLTGYCQLCVGVLSEEIPGNKEAWSYNGACLLISREWAVRRRCRELLKGIFINNKETLFLFIERMKLILDQQTLEAKPRPLEPTDERSKSSAPFVKEFIHWLSSQNIPWREELAVKLFLLTTHPSTNAAHHGLWICAVKRLGIDPSTLVRSNAVSLVTAALSTRPHTLPISVLIRANESVVVPLVMEEVVGVLGSEEALHVTQEEVEILNTPSDQLQNKSLYQELMSSLTGGPEGNIRKESKMYSVQDQRWDAEMRAEMIKKKVDELKDKGVRELLKLTEVSKKLRDSVSARLELEEETRVKMNKVQADVQWSISCLRVLMAGTSDILLLRLPKLMNIIMEGLTSPLINELLSVVWVEATKLTLKNSTETGDLLGWLTLQLLYPSSNCVGRHWDPAHLPGAVGRVLDLLLAESAPTLHWFRPALPFVRHTLQGPSVPWRTPEMITQSVNVIHKASLGLRDCPAGDAAVFPVAETLYLVIQLMMSNDVTSLSASVQRNISESLSQLCRGISDIGPTPDILQVMIEGLYSSNRKVCLTSLHGLHEFRTHLNQDGPMREQLVAWILVCCHDNISEISTMANKLWEEVGMTLSSDLEHTLVTVLSGSLTHIHVAAAKALGQVVKSEPSSSQQVIQTLLQEYSGLYKNLTPVVNEVGRVIGEPLPDPWEGRLGVARGLEHIAPYITVEDSSLVLQFMVPRGLADRHSDVRAGMLAASLAVLSAHEEALSGKLMKLCEEYLSSASDTQEADLVRQSVVVLMGTVAKNLSKDDPRVKSIAQQLLVNLDTPSQEVQESISNCLHPLMSAVREEAADIVASLLNKLLESKSYAQRKGAAYGIAGVVKGLGIPSLKQHSVMQTLQTAIANKKNYKHREGALLAIEQLTVSLGRLFEPYVVKLLPQLLHCYGDGNQYVREATVHAARAIMSRLSGHGVKLILPDLLKGLEDDSWRTKAGSAELLGAMAYCAPKQLSSCLPSIVPPLGEVLNDSHVKVQMAGTEALKQIGSVIKNPEIQALVPVLLQGIADPSSHTNTCLQELLATEFVHIVDAPSLALIMPILQQALGLRSSDGKKMAAQIIGNMYSLTEPKDLSPYLIGILPGLKESLVDPVPDVRSNSAVALGAMVKGLGDEAMTDLLPWLFSTLQSENSSVDRQGAAQGLSEVIRAQGPEHLHTMMPKFVSAVMNTDALPHVRDGYLMLFVYLPAVMAEDFLPHVGSIIPCILQGLADESEFVRDTALRSGQGVVQRFADTAVELFLPELEKGLTDANWRIRYSSIQLLGDLLYCISGLSGKMSTFSKEDENFGTEDAKRLIVEKLGYERRNRVFAGLYMGRSDVALMVRQISLHVWKVVVVNTPRTLREILPELLNLVLRSLVSDVHDRRQVAARTLGDLVRKLGDRVLPEVIPIMQQRLVSGCDEEREGVCIGLSEIVKCTDPDSVEEYASSLLTPIRHALVDLSPNVRTAAAETFSSLHGSLGGKVLEEVIPHILKDLNNEEQHELALDALKQVMKRKSKALLPYLVPKLVTPPINTKALAVLSAVAGEALQRHLQKIIPALLSAAEQHVSEPDHESWVASESVVLSLQDELCVSELIDQLVTATKDVSVARRQTAMKLLFLLCRDGEVDLQDHTHNLIGFFLLCLDDPDDVTVDFAWEGLAAIIKRQDVKDLPGFISSVHSSTKRLIPGIGGADLHGFTRKGIDPVLVMLKETLFKGSPDEREEAALALTHVIKLSSVQVLTTKNNVIQIAGPLIRLISDRFGPSVKIATLDALIELIEKVGSSAKSIFPQLQTSYIKALSEASPGVRQRARKGLVGMSPHALRIDPIYNEIHKGIKNNEDAAVRDTLLQTLGEVTLTRGGSVTPKILSDISTTLQTLLQSTVESTRLQAGNTLGIVACYLSDEERVSVVKEVLSTSPDSGTVQGRLSTLSKLMEVGFNKVAQVGLADKIPPVVMATLSTNNVAILNISLQCAVKCFVHFPEKRDQFVGPVIKAFSSDIFDTRVAVCEGCVYLAEKTTPTDVDSFLSDVIISLIDASKERNPTVKSSAEVAIKRLSKDTLQMCKKFLSPQNVAKVQVLLSRN